MQESLNNIMEEKSEMKSWLSLNNRWGGRVFHGRHSGFPVAVRNFETHQARISYATYEQKSQFVEMRNLTSRVSSLKEKSILAFISTQEF